jgi:hypothetical protein
MKKFDLTARIQRIIILHVILKGSLLLLAKAIPATAEMLTCPPEEGSMTYKVLCVFAISFYK